MKKYLFAFVALGLLSGLCSCNASNSSESINTSEDDSMVNSNCEIYATEYKDIQDVASLTNYQGGTATNLPVENGIIISPYFELNVNGETIPVYATRTAGTIHSFAWIDIKKIDDNVDFNLNVKLDITDRSSVLDKKNPKVVVLPEKRKVTATLNDRTVLAKISNYGNYSFVFNQKQDEPLTLIVAEKENTEELFKNKEVTYVEPGDYSTIPANTTTLFEKENTVYYLKNGRYKIDRISIPANSVLYVEQGAYLEIIPTTTSSAIYSIGEENILVAGRGLIDYSACCGGEVPEGYYNNKGGLIFNNVKNITFSGLTVINSQTWTLCMNACEEVSIHDILFLGYRVYSDGVMLSDCKNAIVENNFIRTGDDAFETKSTTSNGLTENVLFRNCDAWTDKGVAFGCIYESNHDTSDVHFEDCTVGFALGSWSNHLGCCVIQMGDRKGAKMQDITFNNFEIYSSSNPAICNIYIGGSGGRGQGYGIVKNIYFSNIIARRNYGAYLNLRTFDSENCEIHTVYMDNIVSNGIELTSENYKDDGYITDNVVGGYDFRKLKINTLKK